MKKNYQKLYQQFNTSDTTLVISGYPEKGRNGKSHGIAWYTQKYLEPLAQEYNQRFVVLAEKNHHNEPTLYADGKILVLRTFDNDRIHLYPQILNWLKTFSRIRNIHVHSEFGMKAGIWHFGLLIPFLALIKLAGRRITFFSHNVIDDIGVLSGHLNIKPNSLLAKSINFALRIYYAFLALLSDSIVVLDTAIADRLAQFVSKKKITTLAISVDKKTTRLSKRQAKSKLGIPPDEKVLLYFGFVSWYKGADWLINTFDSFTKSDKTTNTHLMIAGGQSYSLAHKSHYQTYYADLENTARNNDAIILTGYVQENDLDLYYAAADLVILPYRGFMGASGCLTHALAYDKPVMVSSKMNALFSNPDITQALVNTGLSQSTINFDLNLAGMVKIFDSLADRETLNQLRSFSKHVAQLRSPKHTAANDYQALIKDNDPQQNTKVSTNVVDTRTSLQQRLASAKLISYTETWSNS